MTIKNTTTTSVQSTLSGYKVVDMIYNLPDSYKLTLGDKAKVEEVRKAYDSLSENEKSKVLRYDLYYLEDAESTIKRLEKIESDKEKGKELVTRIERLKSKVGYSKNGETVTIDNKKVKDNRDEVENIRKEYDALDWSFRYEGNKLVTNYYDFLSIECGLA